MANFYKDFHLPNENTNKLLSIDNNGKLTSSNYSDLDISNIISNVNNTQNNINIITNNISNINNDLTNINSNISNINSELIIMGNREDVMEADINALKQTMGNTLNTLININGENLNS